MGLVSLAISGGPRYGIDFKGGVQLELDVTPTTADAKPLDIQRLRDILDENGITGCEIQSISSSEGRSLVLIKALAVENVGDSIINLIKTNFPDNVDEENFVRLQDEVGPRIGNELREKAIMAIFGLCWASSFTSGGVSNFPSASLLSSHCSMMSLSPWVCFHSWDTRSIFRWWQHFLPLWVIPSTTPSWCLTASVKT